MKTYKILLTITMLILSMSLFADSGEGISGSVTLSSKNAISGYVKNAQSGIGIANALITITAAGGQTYQVTTNSDGVYSYSMMPTGSFNISVTAQGYLPSNITVNTTNNCTLNIFSLTPTGSGYVTINDALTIYADNVVQSPPNVYTVSGNVNINGIMYFNGQIAVDKRPSLNYPEISGDCGFYASDIQGADVQMKNSTHNFIYYAKDNTLNPKSFSHIIDGVFSIGGFNVNLGQFIIQPDGSQIESKVIVKMQYPFDKIFEYLQQQSTSPSKFIEDCSFSRIYSKTDGQITAGSISGLNCNFIVFGIEDGNLYYDESTHVFGGGFKLRIPGTPSLNNQSDFAPNEPDSVPDIPVVLKSQDGVIVDTTQLSNLMGISQFFDPEFLKFGVQAEFVSGALNDLVLTIGTKIPIDGTGLFITEINGGVENLVNKNDWRIIANVDIETGLEIPQLGSAIKLDNFGVNIHPLNYFEGSGSFEVFGYPCSDAFIAYDSRKKSLNGEANLDINGMLIGKSTINLRSGDFNGGGEFTLTTGTNLPFWLNWLENKAIGTSAAYIHNNEITTQNSFMGLALSQKFEFGKQGFPWFHYYIGTNYGPMIPIWKGMLSGGSGFQFLVPENCPQFFMVAGDTMNLSQVDFQLVDPDGKTYDSTWANYHKFTDHHQTLMVIDKPMPGEWTFLTNDTLNLRYEPRFMNQQPTGLVALPSNKSSLSNNITMDFNDFADTLDVKVFYDTDTANYDGTFIQEFQVLNNADLTFEWQNQNIPDGIYYIYFMLDDRKNAPVMQYAPGSILVSHSYFSEIPQNIQVNQVSDSLHVQWEENTNPTIKFTKVYMKNLSTYRVSQFAISEGHEVYIKDLKPGQAYAVWCCFLDQSQNMGPVSDIVNTNFIKPDSLNNPPYFKNNPAVNWTLIAGETSNFTLLAEDADSNSLTFALPGDTLGITQTGNQLQWVPTDLQCGVHKLLVTVSDGIDSDTTFIQLVVYSQEQAAVQAGFSSMNLYDNDNKFIKIRNLRSQATNIEVSVSDINTGDSVFVSCRKVDNFEFIGKFDISSGPQSSLHVTSGDTLLLRYLYNGQTYVSKARYDSTAQPSDNIAPDAISDLVLSKQRGNQIKLLWTATGDNASIGKSYKYDIRYAFSPILSDAGYLVANRILTYPIPSMAGLKDSLYLNLDTLQGILNHDSIWFSIRAEDANQNRSTLGISPSIDYRLSPKNIIAEIQDVYKIKLNWDGNSTAPGFQYYKLYTRIDTSAYILLTDTVTCSNYIHNLFGAPDGDFQYAIQAVYVNGISDTSFSNPVQLQRFSDVSVLCQLPDTNSYDSITFTMQGLDSVYTQTFSTLTNMTGLVLMDNVYLGDYKISISKSGYYPIIDTISINSETNTFDFTMVKTSPSNILIGQVYYDNSLLSPLNNVIVNLKNSNNIIVASSLTDSNGYFSFNVYDGQYQLSILCSKLWGGVNAVDALLVLKHFTGLTYLSGLHLAAADVNANGNVNSVDALLLTKRFVAIINSFASSDWLFNNDTVVFDGNSTIIKNIKGLCFGDVNGSYIPPNCAQSITIADAGDDQLNVTGTTTSLTANIVTVNETGSWNILSGIGGQLQNIHDPLSVLSGNFGETYILEWRITNNCEFSADTVTISFSDNFQCGTDSIFYGEIYYHTVQIGTQCWMRENLNIGTYVPSIYTGSYHSDVSNNSVIEKYCYNNDPANCAIYGGLYDWDEMMQYSTTPGIQGICATGWHIPTDTDWCTLTLYLDTEVNCGTFGWSGVNAGGKMKETGLTHWYSPNTGANNESGFAAFGSGARDYDGHFYALNQYSFFWSSSEYSGSNGICRRLDYNIANVKRSNGYKVLAFSVRCIKD